MSEAAVHSWHLLVRQARNLAREPIWIALLLIQPMLWLLLYSQLFQRITRLGGFGTDDYVDFFLPGVVVMNAFFAGTWAGMTMISDLDRGVLERFLATPARRSALVASQLMRPPCRRGSRPSSCSWSATRSAHGSRRALPAGW